ncbi:hypothetical protein MAUB1S_02002 [Mycolicibacterium aubagnense]
MCSFLVPDVGSDRPNPHIRHRRVERTPTSAACPPLGHESAPCLRQVGGQTETRGTRGIATGSQSVTRKRFVHENPRPARKIVHKSLVYASRIAVTPCPPAAQMEIRPRVGSGPSVRSLLLGELLGQLGHDATAGRGERVPRSQRRAVDVELRPVDRPERGVQAEAALAVLGRLPRRERGQHHRGEGLVNLVEVEVLQRQAVAGQQPRHRVGRSHEQAVRAVDVVDGSGFRVDEVGQHRDVPLGGPLVGGQQRHRRAVGQRGRVAGGHGGVTQLHAEDGLELGQLLGRGVGAQIVVAVQAQERADQVIEEAAVIGSGHVLVAGSGQGVLVGALDAHLLGGLSGVLAHREAGAGLAVDRDLDADGGRQLADELEPVDVRLGAPQAQQHAAQLVAEGDGRVRRGVHTTGRGHLVPAGSDAVSSRDGRLQAGATGLLQVERRRVRRQRRAQHTLAHEIEITAVFEDGAADHHVELLALEVEAVDQTVQGRGEHVLVGCVRVRTVGSCEGNAITTQDCHPAAAVGLGHGFLQFVGVG